MQWYYTQDGERQGPVDEAELRQLISAGTLNPEDHVWNETMGDQWALISDRPDLTEPSPARKLPIGFPAASVTPAPVATPQEPVVLPAHLAGGISCNAPVRAAWERMKDILFRPFSIGKWFALGVSAWLATLGERGSSFSGSAGDLSGMDSGPGYADLSTIWDQVQEFWQQYGSVVIMVVAGGLLVLTIIAIVVAWLRARGKFMLIDNVVHNTAEISAPWHTFAQHGRSLLGWYILFGFGSLLIYAILGGLGFLTVVLPSIHAQAFPQAVIPALVTLSIAALLIAIVLAYVSRFVEDFIIPLMYHCDLTVLEAWGRFRGLFRAHTSSFIVYPLFYMLLSLASGVAVIAALLATCCLGACLLLIPFVSTVAMLPVSVFFRAYSIEYLAQLGPEYRLFPDEQVAGS